MAKLDSTSTKHPLGEEWIVRVLQGIDVNEVSRQVVVRLDDRRVCLVVVAADGSQDAWSRYSEAAARRAGVTGDRLRPLLASGRTDEWFYVAYDVGHGQPLATQIEPGAISSAQCVQVLHGIGRGLDQAAAGQLYPAQLSPESIFMDPSRGAVLADLGVARQALGNPTVDPDSPWVAPEVLDGAQAGERSTVYSFGALMYTLLTGAPPPAAPLLRGLRPDLPEALDTVISTAMAHDPRRRYRTASEARSLANILMQGDLVPSAAAEPAPRKPPPTAAAKPKRRDTQAAKPKRRGAQAATFRRRSPAAVAAPKRPHTKVTPPKQKQARPTKDNGRPETGPAPRARTASWPNAPAGLLVALAGGVLAAGALAGVLLAGPGPEAPPAPKDFSRSGLQVRLPGDWKGTVPSPGALAAHPAEDPGSGLSLELVDAPVEREEQGNPVRLGRLEAWREPGAEVAGARRAVRYVVPTDSGKLVATCRASARAARGTLGTCERVASTLQLRSASGLPIAAVVEQQESWQREVTRLGKERGAARRKLARADRPTGQRLAAEALERVHDRAAGRFGALPGGEAVAAAARRTAAAYRALARGADGESPRRFNAARARVRRSEAALRRALAGA